MTVPSSLAGDCSWQVYVKHAVLRVVQPLMLTVEQQPVVFFCSVQHGFHHTYHVQPVLPLHCRRTTQ